MRLPTWAAGRCVCSTPVLLCCPFVFYRPALPVARLWPVAQEWLHFPPVWLLSVTTISGWYLPCWWVQVRISETADPAARNLGLALQHELVCSRCGHASTVVEEYTHLRQDGPRRLESHTHHSRDKGVAGELGAWGFTTLLARPQVFCNPGVQVIGVLLDAPEQPALVLFMQPGAAGGRRVKLWHPAPGHRLSAAQLLPGKPSHLPAACYGAFCSTFTDCFGDVLPLELFLCSCAALTIACMLAR